jgi:hypothetical protein
MEQEKHPYFDFVERIAVLIAAQHGIATKDGISCKEFRKTNQTCNTCSADKFCSVVVTMLINKLPDVMKAKDQSDAERICSETVVELHNQFTLAALGIKPIMNEIPLNL